VSSFRGFPPDALAFFAELEGNNERAWWQANKPRFDEAVRGPMRALVDLLEPETGPFHIFRMNRDVRFSNDKTPYKTAQGAVTETEGGSMLYVQISSTGLFVGGGMYHAATDQIARMRRSIDAEASGAAFVAAIAAVRKAGLDVGGGAEPALATAPRGYSRDHARIEYLRWRGCSAGKELGSPAWLHTARAADRIRAVWAKAEPVLSWLDSNVGPSETAPRER
jgi:uncharacterized protein (TIGR02453 family)